MVYFPLVAVSCNYTDLIFRSSKICDIFTFLEWALQHYIEMNPKHIIWIIWIEDFELCNCPQFTCCGNSDYSDNDIIIIYILKLWDVEFIIAVFPLRWTIYGALVLCMLIHLHWLTVTHNHAFYNLHSRNSMYLLKALRTHDAQISPLSFPDYTSSEVACTNHFLLICLHWFRQCTCLSSRSHLK